MSSRTTPLHASHLALNARMVDFAGWEMPVSYPSGTAAEVRACRASAGLFDVSHMGELIVFGPDGRRFVQYATSNTVEKLEPGFGQYSLLLTDAGGILDDVIVFEQEPAAYMIVMNASRTENDRNRLLELARDFDVSLGDLSARTALIAVQGPTAIPLAAALTDAPISSLRRFAVMPCVFAGVFSTVARTGYTGEDGFEIFCPWDRVAHVWDALRSAGAVPCGLGARDVLRLEAAYPLYGHELDEGHTPRESGVSWAVRMDKGDFVGRDALVRRKDSGNETVLVGLRMTEPPNAIAREGFTVFAGGERIGAVTSGTLSPTLAVGIAMARVSRDAGKAGTAVEVDIRGRRAQARVVRLPFYRNGV